MDGHQQLGLLGVNVNQPQAITFGLLVHSFFICHDVHGTIA